MKKTKRTPNDQRADVKNPLTKDFKTDKIHTEKQIKQTTTKIKKTK